MTDAFDAIREGLDTIAAEHERRIFAFEEAVGMAADDFENPAVVAGVERAMLTVLALPDEILTLPVPEAEAIINGLIMSAFYDWHETYVQILNGDVDNEQGE